jgi:hypothetical protein
VFWYFFWETVLPTTGRVNHLAFHLYILIDRQKNLYALYILPLLKNTWFQYIGVPRNQDSLTNLILPILLIPPPSNLLHWRFNDWVQL